MATIKDVAKLAGVSTSTVSHVLNETRFVSEQISERVRTAVNTLNYRPSSIARSLKVNRTNTLGMLVSTSKNPFFAEVVHNVERRCYERGYTLFLCNTDGDAHRMRASLDALEEKRVDGLLLLCSEASNEVLRLLEEERSTPVVIFDWGSDSEHVDRIYDNSLYGGYLATRHLIDMGHTRIGCVTGPMERRSARERVQGFHKAMDEAGLPVPPEWIIEGDYDCAGGVAAMARLHALPDRPDALFVCNDMMALGVFAEAARLGVHVPDDLSVIGYDDIYIAQYMTPPLTTIHQPKGTIAAMAVDTLIDRLGSKREQGKAILIEPGLIERASVRRIA